MFEQDKDGSFQKMIDTVYEVTSKHLLEVLHTKYHFMDHLRVSMSALITIVLKLVLFNLSIIISLCYVHC